jgi:hypothetical protein
LEIHLNIFGQGWRYSPYHNNYSNIYLNALYRSQSVLYMKIPSEEEIRK